MTRRRTTGLLLLAGGVLLPALSLFYACAEPPALTIAAAPQALAPRPGGTLQELVDGAARVTLDRFAGAGLRADELAITLIDIRDPERPRRASFRGDVPVAPAASVVKLFYLVAAQRWIEDGRLKETDELRRALRDMIVDSSNDATHYVVDSLTGTSSGVELPDDEMRAWAEKRGAVNRYFKSLGYADINVNQKTWCEDLYGRERVFVGPHYENRNRLTTDATARLLADIAARRVVTPARSEAMMALLQRDPFSASGDPDDQARGFTGIALPAGARLWSKAGWVSDARHDAAFIELPDGGRFVLVTFTLNHSGEREIIPTVARFVLSGIAGSKG